MFKCSDYVGLLSFFFVHFYIFQIFYNKYVLIE